MACQLTLYGLLQGVVDAPCCVSQLVATLNSNQLMQHKFVIAALTGAGLSAQNVKMHTEISKSVCRTPHNCQMHIVVPTPILGSCRVALNLMQV